MSRLIKALAQCRTLPLQMTIPFHHFLLTLKLFHPSFIYECKNILKETWGRDEKYIREKYLALADISLIAFCEFFDMLGFGITIVYSLGGEE